jgi:hypothetical protein
MYQEFIPENVQQFILKRIDSVAHLEGLLLLRREPNEGWTDEAFAKRLYITSNQAAAILSRLWTDGFVITRSTQPLTYTYQPSSPELEQMADLVADIYSKYLVPVTNLIHAKPKSRVQEFADAFKLKKEEE